MPFPVITIIMPDFSDCFQTRLYALASDPNTFTKEIDNDQLAQFDVWLSVLEEDKMTDEKLSKMLAANKALQENYESLVPQEVIYDCVCMCMYVRTYTVLCVDRESYK